MKNKQIQSKSKKWQLDAYELDILQNNSDFNIIKESATSESGALYEKYARYGKEQRNKKPINIRLGVGDLSLVKSLAKQEGLPYQTLLSSIVHKYATRQLVSAT